MSEACYGQIQLVLGCMFAGKTSELLRRLKKYVLVNKEILLLKYSNDTRYTNKGRKNLVVSHDSDTMRALRVDRLSLNLPGAYSADVIGIDEGQFMDGIVEFCEHFAKLGKIVIVSALNSDFKRDPFKDIAQLVARADKIDHFYAICTLCHTDAAFTRRINKKSQDVIEVGGAEKYIPVCRSCYFVLEIPKRKLELHARAMEKINKMKN